LIHGTEMVGIYVAHNYTFLGRESNFYRYGNYSYVAYISKWLKTEGFQGSLGTNLKAEIRNKMQIF